MKTNYVNLKLQFVLLFVISIALKIEAQGPPVTVTFTHTGAVQIFTVPPCVGSMTILAYGGSGGSGQANSNPGLGGTARGVMTATPGQLLFINVGGQGSLTAGGFNGGGNGGVSASSSGAGGGGGSDIRLGSNLMASRIIVAAGGGGSGGNGFGGPYNCFGGNGGAGSAFTSASGFGGAGATGCQTGANGAEAGGSGPLYGSGGGGGGFTSGGGGGGQPSGATGGYGCTGALGAGGDGGGTSFICGGASGGQNGGGGGGGGYYGGGGGMTGTGGCNGGGGGGSSWVNSTMFSSITYTPSLSAGPGSITITYAFNGSLVNATVSPFAICNGGSAIISASGATSYTWSTNSNASSISVSPGSTTSYTVVGTNSIGCISSAVAVVTVNPVAPTLSIASSAASICPTNTVMLTASGALSYTWSGGITNGVAFAPLTTTSYTVSGQNGCGTTTAVATITVNALPVIALANPSIVCAGGTATLSGGGATTYTWQPGGIVGNNVIVSPQSTTTYSVVGALGNCFGINNVNIVTNPNPTLTATASQSINVCAGTSVTLTATGALGYTWQPGGLTGASIVVTPTAPIAYVVTGTNNFNCSSNTSQVVITSASPTVTAVTNNSMICVGGSATLTASGADAYAWNTGALTGVTVVNPIINTVYSVVGTNTASGCSNTQTVSVSVFVATISVSSPTSVCLGNSVTLNASGANSYTWSNGSNSSSIFVGPVVTTNYLVNGISNIGNMSCSSSGSTAVTVNPIPVVAAVCTRTNICKNEFATITATGASTYLWSNTSTNTVLSVNPIVTTNYSVTGTDANGCVNSATIQIKVSNCVGIGELNASTNVGISIFPNPSSGEFNIKAEQAMELNLVNELGQVIRSIDLNVGNNYQTTIKDIAKGLYFIVGKNKQDLISQKVIVQ